MELTLARRRVTRSLTNTDFESNIRLHSMTWSKVRPKEKTAKDPVMEVVVVMVVVVVL